MKHDGLESAASINVVSCLIGISVFVLNCVFATFRVYGSFVNEAAWAFLGIFFLCTAIAIVSSLLAIADLVLGYREQRWQDRRSAMTALATAVFPLPALLATVVLAGSASKWWIENH
jgi:SNF family Na+-dependent transporter